MRKMDKSAASGRLCYVRVQNVQGQDGVCKRTGSLSAIRKTRLGTAEMNRLFSVAVTNSLLAVLPCDALIRLVATAAG
jgi:hypothetical protein